MRSTPTVIEDAYIIRRRRRPRVCSYRRSARLAAIRTHALRKPEKFYLDACATTFRSGAKNVRPELGTGLRASQRLVPGDDLLCGVPRGGFNTDLHNAGFMVQDKNVFHGYDLRNPLLFFYAIEFPDNMQLAYYVNSEDLDDVPRGARLHKNVKFARIQQGRDPFGDIYWHLVLRVTKTVGIGDELVAENYMIAIEDDDDE